MAYGNPGAMLASMPVPVRRLITSQSTSARQPCACQVAVLLPKGLIRPVSAIGKRYVMTAGMRFQYQIIAV
jgi:hypothetical protein